MSKKKKHNIQQEKTHERKSNLKLSLPEFPRLEFTKSIIFIILFVSLIRIIFLGKDGLYYDEVLCLKDATSLTSHILKTAHPLHFFLLNVSLNFSHTEFFLRLFPALFSILSLFLIFWLGLLISNRLYAIFLTAIFAFSEYMNFYAMDANYYSHMIFFTILSLIGIVGFIKYYRWLFFYIFLLASVLNFVIHPFSGLFSGLALIITITLSLVQRETRNKLYYFKSLTNLIPFAILIASIILGSIIFRQKISSYPILFLKSFKFASWAHNLDFNGYFFFRTFKEYGPSLMYNNVFTYILTPLYFIIFILGLINFKKQKSPFFLIPPFIIIFSFAFIFNTSISRFYHIRYTSYISVLYLMGIAMGLIYISEIAKKFFKGKWKFNIEVPYAILIIFIVLLQFPTTSMLFVKDYSNWKKLMKYLSIKNNFSEDSRLFVYNAMDKIVAKYYMKRYERPDNFISPDRLVHTAHFVSNQNDFAFYDLKRTVFKYPNSYFASYWTELGTTLPTMYNWAARNFTKVIEAPSKHEVSLIQYYGGEKKEKQKANRPYQTASLFKWKYPNSYLLFPYPLKIDISKEINQEKIKIKKDGNKISGEISLFVDFADKYVFEIDSIKTPEILNSINAKLNINNEQNELTKKISLNLPEGIVSVNISVYNITLNENSDLFLIIYPDISEGINIPLANIDDIQQGDDVKIKVESNKQYIYFVYNGFISYPFYVPEDGVYSFEIEGKNDKPNPICWEFWIDSNPKSILPFTKKDNSNEIIKTTYALTKGLHTLKLFYLSEQQNPNSNPDNKNEGYIYSIRLSQTPSDPPQPSFNITEFPFVSDKNGFALSQGWQIQPIETSFSILDNLSEENKTQKEISINIPAKSKTINLLSPAINIGSNKFFLASAELKVKNLLNHSMNLMVLLLDNNGRVLNQAYAYQRGITGDTDWVPFVIFIPIPQSISSIAIVTTIYPNSNFYSKEEGKAFVKNFMIHQ